MGSTLAAAMLLAGSALSLIAALGLHRFADAYARLHAPTKSATLGLALVLASAILTHGTSGRELVTLIFVLMTTPVGAHMISKAMYEIGYRPWERYTSSRTRADQPSPRSRRRPW